MTALAIFGSIFGVGALALLVSATRRDIVRFQRERRRMKALIAEQNRRAKSGTVPICHHGIPMDEQCPQCVHWMREHISRLPQNPRRG